MTPFTLLSRLTPLNFLLKTLHRISRLRAMLAVGLLGLPLLASAHHGFESLVQVRLGKEDTSVVVFMTVPVIAKLLGADAPNIWSETSVAENQAKLRERARDFFVIRTGENLVSMISATAAFEPNGQVAFVLKYPRISAGPSSVEAVYFKNLGPQFTGSLQAYAPPQSETDHYGPLLSSIELSSPHRVLDIPTASSDK